MHASTRAPTRENATCGATSSMAKPSASMVNPAVRRRFSPKRRVSFPISPPWTTAAAMPTTKNISAVPQSDMWNTSSVNRRKVCSIPANQNTTRKLMPSARPSEGCANARFEPREIERRAAVHRGTAAALDRQRLGQRQRGHDQVHEGEPRGHQRRDRAGADVRGEGRQRPAEQRAEREPQSEPEPDEAHAARAPLGRRDVGDVSLGHGDVCGRQPREDARREQQHQGVGEPEQDHAGRRGGDAGEEDGPAPQPIRQPSPHRDEQELHQGVHRAGQGRDEVARAQVAGHPREKRDDHPEAEEIEEDGEEDGAEGSFAHQDSQGEGEQGMD